MLKKILKTVSSRMFYLLVGLFLALGIFAAQAAWNSYVSSGQTLTATSWNEIVAKLVELDGRVPAGGYTGSFALPPNYDSTVCSTTTIHITNGLITNVALNPLPYFMCPNN